MAPPTTDPLPQRDLVLEHRVSKWLLALVQVVEVLPPGSQTGELEERPGDFAEWIQDGSVLSRSEAWG